MMGLTLLILMGVSPMERDASSLPRYLDVESVEAVVASALPAWSACAATSAPELLGVDVTLYVGPDGGATAVSATSDGVAQPCFADAGRALRFRAHDDSSVGVQFTLGLATGQAIPPVRVDLIPRPVEPLFLFLPPDTSPEARQGVLRALGLEDPAPSPTRGW